MNKHGADRLNDDLKEFYVPFEEWPRRGIVFVAVRMVKELGNYEGMSCGKNRYNVVRA